MHSRESSISASLAAVPEEAARPRSREPLPWLHRVPIAIIVMLLCAPFLLVRVPPLVDLPGHMGAAAIAAADPTSPLQQYFGWQWSLTLNLGFHVLMEGLGRFTSLVSAGWFSAVLATGLFAGGCLSVIRVLNPRGGFGAAWALIFVFSYPLLTGFINYVLATGISLLAFAASVALLSRPRARVLLLVAVQPVALLCHAIGGLLLPVLVAAHALGRVIDEGLWRRPKEAFFRLVQDCWPLLAAVATVLIWKLVSPSGGGVTRWQYMSKWYGLVLALRDQSEWLDAATMIACGLVLVAGIVWRARWTWSAGLPVLVMLALFLAIPGRISGSYEVDTRLVPVVAMLALALQDWSRAPRRLAYGVLGVGLLFMVTRLSVTAASFRDYDRDYAVQLSALDHVEEGTRVLALVQHHCGFAEWRRDRRDHLASLASLYRQAWVNDNWSIRGLDMLDVRYRPARRFAVDPSHYVWGSECRGRRLPRLDTVMPKVPLEKVDYVWLIGTGEPKVFHPQLSLVWRQGSSLLYAVQQPPLETFSSVQPLLKRPRRTRG